MNAIADEFSAQEIGSIFLYTNEAHPGENYPPLRTMEQKFRHARALRDVLDVTRPILVDALDGACHRAYGSMPNMTWVFNRPKLVDLLVETEAEMKKVSWPSRQRSAACPLPGRAVRHA